MRRKKTHGLGLLIQLTMVLVLSPSSAFAAKTYPVYFTFTEEMGMRRYLKEGEPGYKNDNYLRLNPGLPALPTGSIVEMQSNYANQSTKKRNYFNRQEDADSTRFINGFKVLYAPGWTAEQIAQINAQSSDLYMIRSSVRKYLPKRAKPTIPAIPAAETPAVKTEVAPVRSTAIAETQTAPKETELAFQTVIPAVRTTTPGAAPAAAEVATGAVTPAADPVFISTNDKIGMRLKTSDGSLAAAETYLPKGSVIKITPDNLENGEHLDYAGGKGVKRDFIDGIEVVSAPGMTSAEIAALNSQPLYMAQSFVKEGDVIAQPTVDNLAAAADNADTEAASPDNPNCTTGDCLEARAATPEALPTSGPCAGVPAEAMAGCQKFLKDKSIPQDALLWALDVYKANLGKLAMSKCVLEPPTDHYSVPNDISKADLVRKGIQNKCQIMINDTRTKHGGIKFRGTFHFINLCSGDKRTGYFNMGTGTFAKNYKNAGGNRTTVLGAFLTNTEDFLYTPNDRDYAAIKRRFGGAPAVSVFGLQNTNNQSANNYKYIHVSPYKSSWGCPSLSPDDADLIKKLADNGPSLVVNYGPKDKMEDPKKCTP